MTTLIFVFLLGGLVLAGITCGVLITMRSARRVLFRRFELHRELSGDWWRRFEKELDAYVHDNGHGGIGNRAPE
jgi:hypothetical protein